MNTYVCARPGHGSSFIGLASTAKAVKGTIAPLCPVHAAEVQREGKEVLSLAVALREAQAVRQQADAVNARKQAARVAAATMKIGSIHHALRGGSQTRKNLHRGFTHDSGWYNYLASR